MGILGLRKTCEKFTNNYHVMKCNLDISARYLLRITGQFRHANMDFYDTTTLFHACSHLLDSDGMR